MNIKYSVIICTRNRAESLEETLRSIAGLEIDCEAPVELLVVDNGSTDHTRQVVASFDSPGFFTTYLVEPEPGVARARTKALQSAAGEILLWTDDDVRVPKDWLIRMARPIIDDEGVIVAGGVDPAPHLEKSLAERPLNAFRGWFACTDWLDPINPTAVVGANMALHRRVRDLVPGFDPELGPGAPQTGFAEEVLLARQLRRLGYRIVPEFNTRVVHYFDEARLAPAAVLDTARKMGRSRAYLFHHWEGKRRRAVFARYLWALLKRAALDLGGRYSVNGLPREARIWAEVHVAFAKTCIHLRSVPRKYV